MIRSANSSIVRAGFDDFLYFILTTFFTAINSLLRQYSKAGIIDLFQMVGHLGVTESKTILAVMSWSSRLLPTCISISCTFPDYSKHEFGLVPPEQGMRVFVAAVLLAQCFFEAKHVQHAQQGLVFYDVIFRINRIKMSFVLNNETQATWTPWYQVVQHWILKHAV